MKFFGQISSIIIALLFISTINFKSILTLNYFYNQTEIADLFCINKDKPQLKCNGKCHLATQMDKVEIEEEEELPFNSNINSHNLEITSILIDASIDTKNISISLIKSDIKELLSFPCKGFYTVNSPPPKV
mgnify:CR=1 FL=1